MEGRYLNVDRHNNSTIQAPIGNEGFTFDIKSFDIKSEEEIENVVAVPIFPLSLSNFTYCEKLGGGTESVYALHSKDKAIKKKFVIKFAAHEDALKLEIMSNAIYSVLGVKVPPMRIYRALPIELVATLPFTKNYQFFKVCPYITEDKELNPNFRKTLLKTCTRNHFLVHVLLGNIDIAKEDNFIIDREGNIYLIDAGANFLFRSKGERRLENPALVSEIDSLRDIRINYLGAKWFDGLSDAELNKQLQAIQMKLGIIEELIWSLSKKLQLPDQLRNEYLHHFSTRLDRLAMRFQLTPQVHAKRDKQALEHLTGAGVFTYSIKNGQIYCLLSQRARHAWYDNFGGESENSDTTLLETAIREVLEESSYQINYLKRDLLNSPFHDLVTGEGDKQFVYRMYLCAYHEIDLNQLRDKEHIVHEWVPLSSLITALEENWLVEIEEQLTIEVVIPEKNKKIIVYPPLYHMLQQMPVFTNLIRLQHGEHLLPTATLGYVFPREKKNLAMHPHTLFRPFMTPEQKRLQVTTTMLKKNRILNELKSSFVKEIAVEKIDLINRLSQSEIHLKTILNDQYQENNLETNVRQFFAIYKPATYDNPLNDNEIELLTQECIQLIHREKQLPNRIFYYHAVNNAIGFIYDVYTALYRVLQADNSWQAIRYHNPHLKTFNNIIEFMSYYSSNGTKKIDNNEDHYNDYAISSNIFLFGNHLTESSHSISYMLNNRIARNVDIKAMLINIFNSFHISTYDIDQLLVLYHRYAKQAGGRLYQISLSKDIASQMSYPAGNRGVQNPFVLNDEKIIDVVKIVEYFQENNDQLSINSKYLSEVQARVLVPADQQLEYHQLIWQPLKLDQQNQYEAILNKIVLDFSFQILNTHSSNAEHSTSKLIKILPSILEFNDLSYTITSHELLIDAINTRDDKKINELVEEFPQLLNTRINFVSSCFSGINDKFYNMIFNFIALLDKKYRLQVAMQYDLTSFDHIHEIAIILDDEKFDFLMKHRTVFDWSKVALLSKLLDAPEAKKAFILACVKDYTTLCYAIEIVNISSEHILPFINQCIADKRLTDDFIEYGYQLISLVGCLPSEEVFEFAMKYQHLVDCTYMVKTIVKIIDDNDRKKVFIFASVKNVPTLLAALEIIPENERLMFIARCVNEGDLSKNFVRQLDELEIILKLLPDEDRFIFANDHIQLIDCNIYGLYAIASSLKKQEAREKFILACIHHSSKLSEKLNLYEEEEKIYFSIAKLIIVISEINQLCHFINTVRDLPSKDKLSFINAHQTILNSLDEETFMIIRKLTLHPIKWNNMVFQPNHQNIKNPAKGIEYLN